jgi:glucose/arabinose dehydrogenase
VCPVAKSKAVVPSAATHRSDNSKERKIVQKMTSRIQRVISIMILVAVLVVGIVVLRTPATLAAPPTEGGLGLEIVPYATGFFQVTDIANAGDERLFVTEQAGTIEIIDGDGEILPTPFLTIPPATICNNYQSGLLGLAFHPDYAENGYFFIHYIVPRDGVSCDLVDQVIARYKVSESDPNVADPASEDVVLRLEHPFDDNYGGDLAFGPQDGYLYLPLGDGGGPRNPDTNPAQDGESLLGKMVRIEVSTSEAGPIYTIPADNPYINDPNVADEVWSLGWRNPFRFSFDRLTGDMYIGDVGDTKFEEVNFQAGDSTGGENYGWPCYEGSFQYTDTVCSGVLSEPIFEGLHQNNTWIVVTGGYVYRGNDYPLMQGYYILSDFGTGEIYTLKRDDVGEWQVTNEGVLAENSISTFGEGADGEIYLADYTYVSDTIYHVVDTRVQPQFLYLPAVQRGAEE